MMTFIWVYIGFVIEVTLISKCQISSTPTWSLILNELGDQIGNWKKITDSSSSSGLQIVAQMDIVSYIFKHTFTTYLSCGSLRKVHYIRNVFGNPGTQKIDLVKWQLLLWATILTDLQNLVVARFSQHLDIFHLSNLKGKILSTVSN